MSNLPPPPPPPPPGRGRGQQRPSGDQRPTPPGGGGGDGLRKPGSWPRWTMWVLLGVVALALLLPSLWPNEAGEQLSYTEFMAQVREGNVDSVVINNSTGAIEGEFDDGTEFRTHGRRRAWPVGERRSDVPREQRRLPVQDAEQQLAAQHRRPAAARAADHRLLRLDAAPGGRPDGQRDVHRAQPGQGLHDRQAFHHVLRHRRLRGRQAGDHRGRRLPAHAGALPGDRRPGPEGHAARRASGHRQDPLRPRRRRRGRGRLPVRHRLGLHGDVRRRRRQPRPRPLPAGPPDGPGDHLHRRDRLHRPQARRRSRRRSRRA